MTVYALGIEHYNNPNIKGDVVGETMYELVRLYILVHQETSERAADSSQNEGQERHGPYP